MRVFRQCLLLALYLRYARSAMLPRSPYEKRISSLLSLVPDRVAGPQPNPLRDWPVLLLRFGELLLRAERLVGLV